jgi:AcrR family transcriptional regulator
VFIEMTKTRRYELKERARRQEETRRRITEATVDLHEEVGPAATSIAEVARRAGVQRLTVYKHFPDEPSLLAACSAHWNASHPPPDADGWREIADPLERTRTALRELYAYYSANERMLGHVTRDARAMPALHDQVERDMSPYLSSIADLVTSPWKLRGKRRGRLAAQLDLILRFEGWQLLSGRADGDVGKAADLAADLVRAAAT